MEGKRGWRGRYERGKDGRELVGRGPRGDLVKGRMKGGCWWWSPEKVDECSQEFSH